MWEKTMHEEWLDWSQSKVFLVIINFKNDLYAICSAYVVYFEQTSTDDETVLYQLCKCFRLFSSVQHSARGVHHGLIR